MMKNRHDYGEFQFDEKFYAKHKDLIDKYFADADLGLDEIHNYRNGLFKFVVATGDMSKDWYGRDLIQPRKYDSKGKQRYQKLLDKIYNENEEIRFEYCETWLGRDMHGIGLLCPKNKQHADMVNAVETDNFYVFQVFQVLKSISDFFDLKLSEYVTHLSALSRTFKKEKKTMTKFELVTRFAKKENEDLLPERQTKSSAGYDFKSSETVIVPAGVTIPTMVSTGVKAKLEPNQVLIIANRSSNASKRGLIVPNGIGVIDADYYNNSQNEGEIFAMFINIGKEDYVIERGDRVMQGIIVKYDKIDDDHVDGIRQGGFGSTNK